MTRRKARRRSSAVAVRQSDVIREVMLGAGQCDTWLTLDELAKLTKYPPASISAQLRHLRKPRYGGFVLAKRPRKVDEILRDTPGGPVWEYRLSYGFRPRATRVFARYSRIL